MSQRGMLIVSCEHGGNKVPRDYRSLFSSPHARQWLISHRGLDPGALPAAQRIATRLDAPLISSTTTRLLVDLNRSVGNPGLFSRFVPEQPPEIRAGILSRFYAPYREQVRAAVQCLVDRGEAALHLSVHTFTPRIRGQWRPLDVGLLFDPARSRENRMCQQWRRRLESAAPRLRVRMNQPYAGVDDGLTSWLRLCFDDESYAGIEIELNHRIFKRSPQRFDRVVDTLIATLPGTM